MGRPVWLQSRRRKMERYTWHRRNCIYEFYHSLLGTIKTRQKTKLDQLENCRIGCSMGNYTFDGRWKCTLKSIPRHQYDSMDSQFSKNLSPVFHNSGSFY